MLVPFYFWQRPCLCAPSPRLEASSNAGARLQPLSCNLGAQPRALQPLGRVVDFSLLSAPSPLAMFWDKSLGSAPEPRSALAALGALFSSRLPFGCVKDISGALSLSLTVKHLSLQPLGDSGAMSLLLVLSPAAPQHHRAPVWGHILEPSTPLGPYPCPHLPVNRFGAPFRPKGPQEPPSQLRAEGQEPRRVPVPQLLASSCPWGWDFGTHSLFTRCQPGQGQVL